MNFGSNVNLTKEIVSYSNAKNNVISNNLSNINNPTYKRMYMNDLKFEDALSQSLKRTKEGHLSGINENNNFMEIHTETSKGRNDENNVNLDKEIIDLTSNKYLFEISSSVLQKEYSKLREAII